MIPLKDTIPARNVPIVNWILIGLNVLLFFVELSFDARGMLEDFIAYFGVVPARFLHFLDAHEFATLFSSMFLHAGWLHLISNMWALYIFGDNVEDRMGPVKFLIFYLLCGLAAGLTHIFFNADATVPSLGASGAIAGVLGAYLVLFPHSRVLTLVPVLFLPLFFEIPALFYLLFWFASQLLNGTLEIVHSSYSADSGQHGGVAWWAHAGGFVAGLVLVWVFAPLQRKPRTRYADEYAPW